MRVILAALIALSIVPMAPQRAQASSNPPVAVDDPARLTELQKVLASDGAGSDYFGYSVAISGDTAIVGSYYDDDKGLDSGSAYVFTLVDGAWTQQAKLVASDGQAGDFFGYRVALSGDTALISAYGDDDGGMLAGAAYVFTRSGSIWTQQAKIRPSGGAEYDYFGFSVAVSGDTALVGATGDDDDGSMSGSAFVFTRSGSIWTQQAKIKAADAAEGDQFSNSVALAGDTALIGAYADDDAGTSSGAAYVFVGSGSTWSQQAKLTAADGAEYDYFGYSLAVSGDTVLVGAYGDDDGDTSTGSAYVFARTDTTWAPEDKLTAGDAAAGDAFGRAVALSGDTALIGAAWDDDKGLDSGSAYVFTRLVTTWTEQNKLTDDDGAAGDSFGCAASLSGDMAVVGAFTDDDMGGESGSAYFSSPGYMTTEDTAVDFNVLANDTDVEGDPLTAALVAGPSNGEVTLAPSGDATYTPDPDWSGTDTFTYRASDGDADSNTATATVIVTPVNDAPVAADDPGLMSAVTSAVAGDGAPGDWLGVDVDISGDIAVVGAYGDDDGGVSSGSAYVFVKSGTAWIQQAKLVAEDAAVHSWFGNSVAIEGDTVVVGAPMADSPAADAGAVYVFTRSGSTWTQAAKLVGDGVADSRFGWAVDLSGNTLVSGSGSDEGWKGAAYVFTGSGPTWTRQARLTASDGQYADEMGDAAAVCGDVIVLGARGDDDEAYGAGAAYVFTRSMGVWTQADKVTASSSGYEGYFGQSVAVDGETALIGCAKYNTAYVFTANGADWTEQASLVATDAAGAYNFGFAVALDGTTALVGAYTDWVNAQFSGSAYTFEGSGASWLQTRKFSAGDGAYNDQYGISVALDGGRAIIGAYQDDTVGGADAGSAYIYSEGVYEVAEDEQLTVAAPGILANDTDPEGGSLEATAVVGPQHGILGLNADGSFTYDSVADYSGPDSFTYTASDGLLDSNVATVSIVVTPVNDAPVAVADSYSVAEDGTLTRTAPGVLANDVDADGDSLEATTVAGPLHGTLDLNVDGSFTYEPAEEYSGPDSFTYKANDGSTYSNTATVTITVTPVNEAPVAADDAKTTAEDTKLTVAAPGVLANDTDAEGDPLTASLVTGPAHGTLALSANGSYTYTPHADWFGVDTFVYRAYDGTAYSNTATVRITVTSVDDAVAYVPIAGTNRYATAIAASKEAYPSGAGTVVIATGENWPDALGGSALAGTVEGPLLLTKPGELPAAVVAEITRLNATNAYILGGTAAVTQAVEDALNAKLSGTVTRIAGTSRYGTANKIADEVIRLQGSKFAGGAFIATGDNFPDALGASPLAASTGAPILLTKSGGTPYLPSKVDSAVILGGEAAVTPVTEASCAHRARHLEGHTRRRH